MWLLQVVQEKVRLIGERVGCCYLWVVLFKGRIGRTISFHLKISLYQCGANIRIRTSIPTPTAISHLLVPFSA